MGSSSQLLKAASKGLLLRNLRGLSTAVCRSSPWLMLPSNEVADTFTPDSKLHSMDYSFYRLSDKQTISLRNKSKGTNPIPHDAFCYGSSKGWLLYSDPADCTLFLTNPLGTPSPPTITLPPVTTLSSIRVVIPNSKNKIVHTGKLLLTNDLRYFSPKEMYTRIIQSFAISGSPESQDCVIMVIQYWTNKISLCKPATNMEEAWTNLDVDPNPDEFFHAIVYSSKDKLFYGLNNFDFGVVTWDFRDHLEPKRETYQPVFTDKTNLEEVVDIMSKGLTSYYLVESLEDILLVLWHSNHVDRDGHISYDAFEDKDNIVPIKTLRFDVYRLSDGKDSWEHMESLGDRVLFMGMNEPFSLSASDFPELKPNSIYFAGPASDECHYSASDWGIYNLEDDTITRHYPCSYWSKLRPPPIWIDRNNTETNICLTDVASQKEMKVSTTHKCSGENLRNGFSRMFCGKSANEFTTVFTNGGDIHHYFKS